MRQIYRKGEMYEKLITGCFGNTAYIWNSAEELHQSGYDGKVMIRYAGLLNGKRVWQPGISVSDVDSVIRGLVNEGARRDWLSIGEWLPVDRIRLNAEMALSERHIDLFYSTEKLPMRESLCAGGKTVQGLEANSILKYYLDPAVFDFLIDLIHDPGYLLDPRPVVEFTVFECPVGIFHEPVVVWEVRSDWAMGHYYSGSF